MGMKQIEVTITSALAGVSILLVIALFTLSKANQEDSLILQSQQNTINQARLAGQAGQSIIRDLAALSVQNEKIRILLANNGYNVTRNATPPAQTGDQ